MNIGIKDRFLEIPLNGLLDEMSNEDRMALALKALYHPDTLKAVVDDIINGPPKKEYHEARALLLKHMPEVHRKLVRGLLLQIEILQRNLQGANDRAAKLYYGWPSDRNSERPRNFITPKEITIHDQDVLYFVNDFFDQQRRKHEQNSA